MTQALYRRYRPQTFSEIIGQHHIADTLRNALRQQRIGHAYLFTGPRGTGKTSTARILAKAVNCLAAAVDDRPDNSCAVCVAINENRLLDLIEIDAASNTSVDDVRELRDRVAFVPNEARYKVYVIDEVHMLSTSAFNALLKTLEEPPAHVIFILATTEPHKIPATVLSRCQRFDFHRISAHDIAAHLQDIAQREGVQITPEAVATIARSATGSMRDALSMLDQITAYGHSEIDGELVRDVLGMVSGEAVNRLVAAIAAGEPAAVLGELHGLMEQGVDLNQLVAQLIDHLRVLLLLNVGRDARLVDLPAALLETMQKQAAAFQPTQLMHTIRVLNEAALALKTPFAGYLPVELALLESVGLGEAPQPTATAAPVANKPRPQPAAQPKRSAPSRPATSAPRSAPARRSTPPPPSKPKVKAVPQPSPTEDPRLQEIQQQLLERVGQHSAKLQAVLRGGRVVALSDEELVLSFQYDFHLKSTQAEIDTVSKVAAEVLGRSITVRALAAADAGKYVASHHADQKAVAPSSPKASPDTPTSAEPAEDPLLRMAVEELGAEIKSVESSEPD